MKEIKLQFPRCSQFVTQVEVVATDKYAAGGNVLELRIRGHAQSGYDIGSRDLHV